MARRSLLAIGLCVFVMVSSLGAVPAPVPSWNEVKKIPPPGVAVPDSDKAELQSGVVDLGRQVESVRESLTTKPALLALLPDVQIYHNAVRYALTYDEFLAKGDIAKAKVLLNEGMERAKSLQDGQAPWTKASGLVARGYVLAW
jgi:hypothetical protein